METTQTRRPNAALINRQWFDSARNVLTPAEMGELLLAAVSYVLGVPDAPKSSGKVAVVFAMVKPALDSDIAAYAERCERNAANARAKRVAASGSESQPVVAITNNNNNINNNINNNNISISADDEEREKVVFAISYYFFTKGVTEPLVEAQRFYDYYDRQGWRSNKGAPIVSKIAAARMWHIESAIVPTDPFRAAWARIFKEKRAYSARIWSCYVSASLNSEKTLAVLRLVDCATNAPWLECNALEDLRLWVAQIGANGLQYVG